MSSILEQVVGRLQQNGGRALSDYLTTQRWFGAKGRPIAEIGVLDYVRLADAPQTVALMILKVAYADHGEDLYLLPILIAEPIPQTGAIVALERPEGTAVARDATEDADASLALLEGIRRESQWNGRGRFVCERFATDSIPSIEGRAVARIRGEQSNTSIVYGKRLILKLIRKLERGINPDYEITKFLTTKTSYRHTPALIGHIRYDGPFAESAFSATAGMLQTFVPNDGDGWTSTLRHLNGVVARMRHGTTGADKARRADEEMDRFTEEMRRLGRITAELHLALASDKADPSFRPDPTTQEDVDRWRRAVMAEVRTTLDLLGTEAPEHSREGLPSPRELHARCEERLEGLSLLLTDSVSKIRIHGDYHLGQVLKTEDGFTILDFEGEPARPLDERRAKSYALKDVAGMLRSLNYAKHAVAREHPSLSEADRAVLDEWERHMKGALVEGYLQAAPPGAAVFLPRTIEGVERLLLVFQLEKVLYELRYEIRHRPAWIGIPIQGLRYVLDPPHFKRKV
jgi:maltose alpha-D-glucosyltransferase/alpha-amylase